MAQFGTFGGGGNSGGFSGGGGHGIEQALHELVRINAALNHEVMQQAFLLADSRRRVAKMEAEMTLRDRGGTPRMPIDFRSQYGEDALIWSLFDGKTDGFFIEVGAFDGYHYSTSYGLEAAGWTGLLIEAIPERYEQCAARRPGARVVNAALGKRGSAGTATFTVVQDNYGGMLSYHTTDEEHLSDLRQGQFLKKSVTVPLTTMDALLDSHPKVSGPGGEVPLRVDAASIDVEGGELNLLDGFDLARWKPTVLIVEDNSKGQSPLGKDVIACLTRAGYVRMGWLFVNGVFVRKDVPEVFDRAMKIMRP